MIPQDAERHALVKLREAARRCQQEQRSQTGRLAEEQLAGARAEQRCQQLAEECQQRAQRYDQKLQRLAQQDADEKKLEKSKGVYIYIYTYVCIWGCS